MKKNLKRILALLMALCMILSLAACGKDEESSSTVEGGSNTKLLAQELGYGFLSEYKTLDLPLNYVNNVSVVGDKVYLSGDYYDEETYTSTTLLLEVNTETGEFTETPVKQLEDNQYIQNFVVSPDGSGYWMIVCTYDTGETYEEIDPEFGVDMEDSGETEGSAVEEEAPAVDEEGVVVMPALDAADSGIEVTPLSATAVAIPEVAVEEVIEDSTEEESEEDFLDDASYYTPTEVYTLEKFDMAGNKIAEIDLNPVMESMEYFYVQNLLELTDGDILLFCDENTFVFGADGTRKEDIAISGYVESAVPLSDGTAVISYYDYENGGNVMAKLENGTLTPIESDYNTINGSRFFPCDDSSLYLTDYNILYKMDLATGKTEQVLSWLDSDIVGTNVTGVASLGADKLIAITSRYDEIASDFVYEMITMTKTPFEEIPERTVLTLGCVWTDSRTEQQVINFNRQNQDYRITMVDYSQYNTEEDYTLGQKQLEKDIVTGACPDIIDINGLSSVTKFAGKGVFADLAAMIEQDPDYSMDSFMSGPINAFTLDGKLYAMPLTCSVSTMYGSARLLGEDTTSLNFEQLGQAISSLEEDQKVMQYITSSGMLDNLVNWNFDKFVDYTTANCSFDSPEFIALLNMVKDLPAEYDWESETTVYRDDMQMLQEGSCLFSNGYLSDSWSVKYMYNLYTAENGILRIGTLGREDGAPMMNIYYGLAISASGKHQDVAWEFIKSMLTDEAQASYYEIPVTVSAFQKHMEDAMEKPYYMDGDEKVYYEDTMWIGETQYTLEPLTQEQVDAFRDYVNSAVYVGNYDSDIMKIISEEAEAFFAGDKTAEETASLIQNRVKIYLGETS